MAKKAEQNDRHERSDVKVYNKRLTNRQMRRAARRDPAGAPIKSMFRGYSQ